MTHARRSQAHRASLVVVLGALLLAAVPASASVPRHDAPKAVVVSIPGATASLAALLPVGRDEDFALFAGEELGRALGQGDDSSRFALGIAPNELDLAGLALASRVRELGFHPLQGLDLVDAESLRGPPEREPKTRIGGLELSEPFLQREKGELSLGLRWACDASRCGLAEGKPLDPLGLASTPGQSVRRFFGRIWGNIQGFVNAPVERYIDSQTQGYERDQAFKLFGPAVRDAVMVRQLRRNWARAEHELPGAVPGVNTVRGIVAGVSAARHGDEGGTVDAVADTTLSLMGDVAVLKGVTGGSGEAIPAKPRTVQEFLPQARRRLEATKAEYGNATAYGMNGPRPPRSPLGNDVVESYPDPDPIVYENGLRPDTPVVDHLRARALRGHPTDPANLHMKAWSENSRKGWHEGNYLRQKEKLISDGLSPEAAEWVLEDYLRWIETDIHATPADPAKLDKLKSP